MSSATMTRFHNRTSAICQFHRPPYWSLLRHRPRTTFPVALQPVPWVVVQVGGVVIVCTRVSFTHSEILLAFSSYVPTRCVHSPVTTLLFAEVAQVRLAPTMFDAATTMRQR